MPDITDPYLVLGVARGATKAQIKAAHRTLAKRYHPDAATGDAHRFRAVHEAYELLADPLRRREWDRLNAPGPLRADDVPRPAARRRRTATDAAAATGGGAAPPPPRPEPTARTYRWSASEVPWWEEGVRSENRRQPGARRPRAAASPGASSTAAGTEEQPPPTDRSAGPRSSADFEVYNRSSGAAWSSAARQYFRRFDADLPKHGQFRHQGTQPLTGARARVAAEEEARARSRQGATASPPPPSPRPQPQAPPRQAYAYAAGVAHSAEQVNAARAATQRAARAAAWPGFRERLFAALLAWIPIALVVGYGGSTATGCDHAAVACPAWFEPTQTVAIAVVLGLLVALPRVAFVGAVASLGMAAVGAVLIAVLAMSSVLPPLPRPIAIVSLAILGATYAMSICVVALNRRLLPWAVDR